MKYIVYLTTCSANNKIYVGVHKTINPEIFDGYIGCGVYIDHPSSYKKSMTPFQKAVTKYGISCFKREIIEIFDDATSAYKLEESIVTKEFINDDTYYNIKLGGNGGSPESWKVRVYMYDLDGNFIDDFDSAFDCCRCFDPKAKNGSSVLKAIRTGQTLHGYQFSRIKVDKMPKHATKFGSHNYKRKVGKYDDKWNLIEVFESTLDCIKAGYVNVSHAIKKKQHCLGFRFKYID